MGIHQIQIRHDEVEDRLLLRLSTTDGCEFRFWLTRRFTRRLWTLLVRMLEWDRAVRQQMDPVNRRTVLEMQNEGYAQQADYSKQFEDASRRMPLGEAPVLVSKARGDKGDEGVQMLSLHPQNGRGIDLTLDTKLLHIFTRLLQEAVAKTDWDAKLVFNERAAPEAPVQDALPRKLN